MTRVTRVTRDSLVYTRVPKIDHSTRVTRVTRDSLVYTRVVLYINI